MGKKKRVNTRVGVRKKNDNFSTFIYFIYLDRWTNTYVAASFITLINKPPGRVYGVRAPFWARRVYIDYVFIAIIKCEEIEPDWSRKGIYLRAQA